ncbi:hypothetical protein CR513_19407, partial [Mucuna pruriens]
MRKLIATNPKRKGHTSSSFLGNITSKEFQDKLPRWCRSHVTTLKVSKYPMDELLGTLKLKIKVKWCGTSAKDLNISSMDDLTWRRRKRSHSSRKRKDEEAYICLMADTTLEGEEVDDKEVISNYLNHLQIAYQELLSKPSTLSIENKSLKEEKAKDLSTVNILEVHEQLQEKVIDLRQSLAKFVNGSENLKKILKHKRHPYDKSSISYDKKKDLKKNMSISHCLNCGRFGDLSYDCIDHLKGLSKPSRTNKKRPKRILVPKNMIVPIANWFDSRKETPIMVPKQWLLMSHDKRKVHVPRP